MPDMLLTLASLLCCSTPLTAASQESSRTFAYADYSFGFELQLPSDWTYDRARYPGNAGSIGLLRGRYADGARSLKLEVYRLGLRRTFPQWVNDFTRQLADVEGATHIEVKTLHEGRGDCVIEVDAALGMMETKRHYLCVPFDARTIWVLMLAVVGNDPANHQAAESALEVAHASLKLLHDRVDKEELTQALERGTELLRQLRRQAAQAPAMQSPRYYEIIGPDGPIGYTRISQSSDTQHGKPGARLTEHTWEFGADGQARYVRMNAFVSRDFVTELIETRADYIPPAGDSSVVLTTLDQCVREGDSLFSSYSRSDQPTTKEAPPPIETGKAYLPRVWVRRLPALLGPAGAELHAFSIYDAEIRGPVLYLIRSADSEQAADASEQSADPREQNADPLAQRGAGAAPKATGGFEVREGYAARPAMLYVDDNGMMTRYVAGEVTLELRSESYIEERYAGKRQAAQRRLPS